MARQVRWSEVRGGVIACVALVAIAFGVLRFMRVGALHGDTFRMYAVVGEARGILKGSEVWLSGQKIGKITDIRFLPPSASDQSRHIEIDMEVLERYRGALRRDAVAQIRSGGSIIGPAVVYLSPGTTRGAMLQRGDTVHAKPQADVEGAGAQMAGAGKEFSLIMANVKLLGTQLRSAQGTVGALMQGTAMDERTSRRRGPMAEITRARSQAARLGKGLRADGTAALIMRGGLTPRTERVLARVDSVRTLLASSSTSVGRFRRDSTLMTAVAEIREELTQVRALLDAPNGTVGRFRTDSSITNSIAEAQRQMALLMADFKKHPLRYLSF